jgi:ribosomal protein S18 acetylase RimI-like enzyme
MKIFLDDERPSPEGWTLVRWPDEVIALLQSGTVEELSLDHDLGDDERGTGYHVLLWIEEAVATRGFRPPRIRVHSANSSARQKMEAAVGAIYRLASDPPGDGKGPAAGESMDIRRASEDDLAAMLVIFQAVVATGDTLPFANATDEDVFRMQWFGAGEIAYVASVGARVCGMYKFGANYPDLGSHVASATYLVSPSDRGKGIGRALVEHSLAQAEGAGYLAMQFNYVVSTNTVAISLYEKLGFSIVGTLPKAFRHRRLGLVDAHVMYRFLGGHDLEPSPLKP